MQFISEYLRILYHVTIIINFPFSAADCKFQCHWKCLAAYERAREMPAAAEDRCSVDAAAAASAMTSIAVERDQAGGSPDQQAEVAAGSEIPETDVMMGRERCGGPDAVVGLHTAECPVVPPEAGETGPETEDSVVARRTQDSTVVVQGTQDSTVVHAEDSTTAVLQTDDPTECTAAESSAPLTGETAVTTENVAESTAGGSQQVGETRVYDRTPNLKLFFYNYILV